MKTEHGQTQVSPEGTPALAEEAGGFFRSARLSTRLCALVLVAALPAVGLALWKTHVERERRTDEARAQTSRLAAQVASEHRRIMDSGRGLLVAVSHLPQVIQGEAAPCRAVLSQILDYYRIYANIGVTDLEGNVICSARPSTPDVNLSDRAYFEEVLRTGDFTVGEYQASRITNKPSISFAYPVKNEQGEPTAVVIAALDLNVLAVVAEGFLTQLPKGSVFTMLDGAGNIIALKPDGLERLGSPLSDAPLLARVLSSQASTVREETPWGFMVHAYAPVLNPMRQTEWYTLISFPENELFGPADRSFRDSLLMLGVVLVIAAVLGLLVAHKLVLRPTAKILESTRLMTAGNLGVRIGPRYVAGELGELARSFDGLAEALGLRESEVEENQERLAALSRRLIAAQEDERRRIARELHDELGQLLTGAKLNLVSLQGGSARPHPGFDPLVDTLDLVGRAITTVRELSTELRPAVLDDAGLEEALHWLLDRVSLRAGFEGHLEAEPLGDLAPEVETTLFRFAQEALTNVTRHASATSVAMTLHRRGDEVELVVQDDGVGFDAAAARGRAMQGKSLGMIGMEERVTLAGGRLEVDTAPGRGTLLRAVVPLLGSLTESWKDQAAS